MALWHTPYLDERARRRSCCATRPTASGYFPPQTGLLLNSWGAPIDFTNPQALRLVAGPDPPLHRPWASRASSSTTARTSCRASPARATSGGSPTAATSARCTAATSCSITACTPRRCRQTAASCSAAPGSYGDQTERARVIWPGDLDATFAKHGEPVRRRRSVRAVGGLPASLIAGLSLGPVGLPVLRRRHRRLPPLARPTRRRSCAGSSRPRSRR